MSSIGIGLLARGHQKVRLLSKHLCFNHILLGNYQAVLHDYQAN